jgi:hypothetical protein
VGQRPLAIDPLTKLTVNPHKLTSSTSIVAGIVAGIVIPVAGKWSSILVQFT